MARRSTFRETHREQRGFRRDVGTIKLASFSLGSIIGSGWLLAALTAATSAGGASIVSWLLAGVIIMVLALVHAELGAAYPLAGGTARWPRLAFGSLGGFTAGWMSWLQAVTIAPIEVEAALSYLDHQWRGLVNTGGALTPTGLGVAAALMLLFTVINILGVRWLATSNVITMFWKIAVPFLTIISLFLVEFQSSNFTAGGGFAPYGAHGVFAALPLGAIFALQGFEQATQMAAEAHDPQRNVPRAVIGSVIIGTVLYVALEVVFIGALNPSHLTDGWANPVSKGDFGPYATLATGLGLGWLAIFLYIDAFISPAGTGLINMGIASRLSYSLGYAGYLPRTVTRMSSRGVPITSIILAFVVGLICFLPFPSWQSLVSLVTSATVIMYAFAPITLLVLRKADPNRARPYRVPAAPVLAPAAFIAANEIIYWTSWATVEKMMLLIGTGYLLFGISYALGRPIERPPLDPRSLIWILPWFTGLAAISHLGQYGGTQLIPAWIDLGVVALFSLLICALAVHLGLPTERVTATVALDQLDTPPLHPEQRLTHDALREQKPTEVDTRATYR
jgi:amino acid transporter